MPSRMSVTILTGRSPENNVTRKLKNWMSNIGILQSSGACFRVQNDLDLLRSPQIRNDCPSHRSRESPMTLDRRLLRHLLLLVLFGGLSVAQSAPPMPPIRVKVVVVTMFERGEDTGDVPGEFQLWVEREHLDQVLPLPAGYHHVRMNQDGVLGMLTGVATAKAAASVMALGLDPRFDLTKAYWLIAGIGGGDPADVSLGSAVWANHVIDGDIGYEIDAREIPQNWPT